MLTVSSAAADTKLLSLAEIESALGITDTASDSALADLSVQLSEAIARECGVETDGVTPPTFREETLIDKLGLPCTDRFVPARPGSRTLDDRRMGAAGAPLPGTRQGAPDLSCERSRATNRNASPMTAAPPGSRRLARLSAR